MTVDDQTPVDETPEAPKRDMEALVQQEAQTRPERLQRLSAQVDGLFQGEALEPLRDDIKQRSFNTPQCGEFHTEGLFMDTHLERILHTIDEMEAGHFHPMVAKNLHEGMQKIARENKHTLQKYAYLHDIAKPDCLAVKYEDGRREEVTWDEWQSRLPEGVNGNPAAMKAFYVENGINGIGYIHKDGEAKKAHGKAGVAKLTEYGDALPVPPIMLQAIERHEVAFQFQNISVKTYAKYFGGLSDEERMWAITASYIDTASSIRENGEPDLSNFRFMVDSANNYERITAVEAAILSVEGLDPNKVQNAIQALTNQQARIEESAEQIAERLATECKISRYDKAKLGVSLQALVTTGQIDEAARDSILGAVDDETGQIAKKPMKNARKKIEQAANMLIQEAITASEIK